MSNPTELLDLDRLEALARAATIGPWLHRHDPGNPVGFQHCVKMQGEFGTWICDCLDNADLSVDGGVAGERNASYIAAVNPAAVLALIALARRAKPFATGGMAPNKLFLAGEGLPQFCAQPEGHAPQAVATKRLEGSEIFEIAAPYFAWNAPSWHKATQAATGMTGLLTFAEALLKAAPAAQHAESGAPADDYTFIAEATRNVHGIMPTSANTIAVGRAVLAAYRAALAAQSQGAPAAGYFVFEHGCWVATSSDDPRAVKLYRTAIAAKAEAPADDPVGDFQAEARQRKLTDFVQAAQQAAAPGAMAGYKLVPLEPTPEMQQAGFDTPGAHMYNASYRAMVAAAPSAPGTPEAPQKLAHGHRDDYFLMANARRIAARRFSTTPNWAFAAELFATGSTSAHQICQDAGIDPDSATIQRAAQLDGGQDDPAPADCSGMPSSCPDNEGYGCHCSDKRLDGGQEGSESNG